jgi:hypothetical protein
VINGIGRAENPHDHDQIVINVGVRDGTIVSIGASDIKTGSTWMAADMSTHVMMFRTGTEARAQGGEKFAGCEKARRAALVLHKVFIGRGLEEGLAIGASDVIAKMGAPPDDERCVATILEAVRLAFIDIQVTTLAEAIVEVRRLRETA